MTGAPFCSLLFTALTLLPAAGGAVAEPFSRQVTIAPPGRAGPGIELLGSLELGAAAPDGARVAGLSGLAWDADEDVLYAVSDEGHLLHLRPRFDDGRLIDVTYLGTHPLKDSGGRPLRGKRRDAEDLAIRYGANGSRGDTELLVAFERAPRVTRYTPEGVLLETLALPERLANVENYATPNQGLEGLTEHPRHGTLAIPEASLKDDRAGVISLFALDGRHWAYRAADVPASSPTAVEVLPDGRLLVLERAFVSVFSPLVVSLRVADPGTAPEAPDVPVTTVARLDTSEGWKLDNFEGLARHARDRYFMLSDNNGRRHQRTLLVYLRLPGLEER